jgi:hypothetical protein
LERGIITAILSVIMAALTMTANAADWPCFRGPNGDGRTTEKITKWPLVELWRANVGQGFSEVVVSQGKVYTFGWSNNQDTVRCFSESASGVNPTPLWATSYAAGVKGNYAGPYSTPSVSSDGKVYTFSVFGLLNCFDAASGALLWSNADLYVSNPYWGMGCSPLVEGDLVIVNSGGDGNAAYAISRTTHNKVWGTVGNNTRLTSPFAITLGGQRTIISAGQNIYGLDPANGNTLWYFSAPYPPVDIQADIANPLIIDSNMVFTSQGYNSGSAMGNLGGSGLIAQVYKQNSALCTKDHAPVAYGGYVYGVSEDGGFKCINPATGNQVWSSGANTYGTESAVLSAGDQILVISGRTNPGTDYSFNGNFVVAQASSAGYTELYRSNSIITSSYTWTAPTLCNGKLYLRGLNGTMVCFDAGTAPSGNPPTITSATAATGTVNQAFSYQITASDSPTSFSATGLPAGLSVNTGSGLISGTPTVAGNSSATIYAGNSYGTNQATLSFTINAAGVAPVITSPTTASGTANQLFSYLIVASGSPTNFNATGLPAGLSINRSNGVISGTPTASGSSSATMFAINANGQGQATLSFTFNPAPTGGVGYKAQIQFPGYNKPETLVNFPALVALNTGISGFNYSQFLSSSGADLRFTAADGVTQLNYEIDTWNPAGTSYVWVQVPQFAVGTTIWACWGDPSKSTAPPCTTDGSTWDTNFLGVWHLSEAVSSGGTQHDSTSHHNDMVFTGNSSCTSAVPAFIGGGNSISGQGTGMTVADNASIDNLNTFTWSFWANMHDSGNGNSWGRAVLWGKSGKVGFGPHNHASIGDGLQFDEWESGGRQGPTWETVVLGVPVTNHWHYVTGVWNAPGTSGNAYIYGDGTLAETTSGSGAPYNGDSSGNLTWGMVGNIPTEDTADEIRYENVPRSSNWVWACYMTMASNSAFQSYGTVQNGGGVVSNAPPSITSSGSANATVGQSFSYQITANGNPNSFNASGLPAGLSVNTGNGAINGTPTTEGTYPAVISANNGSGTGYATLTITVAAAQTGGQVVYQINCGAGAVSPFAADNFYGTGTSVSTTANPISLTGVSNPAPMAVYQSGRYAATMTYTLPALTAGASYKVRLHFAEFAMTGAGQRVFSTSINGVQVQTNFDVFAAAGGENIAVVKEFNTTADGSGQIIITGVASVNNAKFNGIEIISNTSGGSAPVITSATTAAGTVGQAFSYQITASGSPTNYNATGLPAGLTVNRSNGSISGTPTGAGSSSVTISAINASGTGQATLTLTIDPQSTGGGSLSGSGAAGGVSTVNLTAEGTDDWAHWGFNGMGIDHKSVSGSAVNHITETQGGSLLQYANNANGYSWSDGTPTVNAVATTTGIYVMGTGNSFTITVPADTATRTLKLYVGGWSSAGTLTAHLSDSSASDYTDSSFSNSNASYYVVYTITYKAAAAGQNLTVKWQMASGLSGGNVTLQAATLQVGGGGIQPPTISGTTRTGNSPGLSWSTDSGVTYAVYKSTNLLTGWIAQPLTNIVGDGTAKSFVDAAPLQRAAYYRITAR